MDFLVYDPYVPDAHVTALGGRPAPLDELLTASDFVTVHCPLNQETKAMIAARELGLMKPSAFLLNLARGGIVDEDDLCEVMLRKGIAGAALDVVEEEPPPREHPLFGLDNVIFSPHIAGATEEATARGDWGAAQEAIRVLEGQRPKNPVIDFGD
jgi:D-3-phosphoglycerate dehydrogenase